MQRNGQRERLVQTSAASGTPFDYAHFEIVIEREPGVSEEAK
jgi:hypothetical protein